MTSTVSLESHVRPDGGSGRRPLSKTLPSRRRSPLPSFLLELLGGLCGFSPCDGIRLGRSIWWDEETQTLYERSRKRKKSQVVEPSGKLTRPEGEVDLGGFTATGGKCRHLLWGSLAGWVARARKRLARWRFCLFSRLIWVSNFPDLYLFC